MLALVHMPSPYLQIASERCSTTNVVTIPGCLDGVWAVDNTIGMIITLALACGSTFTAPSANAWLTGNYYAAPGQINAVAATSDVFRITGVIVVPGIEAPSAARSPLIMRPYDQELLACQRYYWKDASPRNMSAYVQDFSFRLINHPYPVQMRATPTVTGTVTQGSPGFATSNTVFIASATSVPIGNGCNLTLSIADARL